jgi:hypothetical protein
VSINFPLAFQDLGEHQRQQRQNQQRQQPQHPQLQ